MGVETLRLHGKQVGAVTVERVTVKWTCTISTSLTTGSASIVHMPVGRSLSLLVRVHEQCESRGCSLHVVAPSRAVCRPIEVAELDMRLNIMRTIDEALATEGQGW